tara:strand:- start:48 stop:245 length:198 start_codon:yes stop_codon:yes gene_type:complete
MVVMTQPPTYGLGSLTKVRLNAPLTDSLTSTHLQQLGGVTVDEEREGEAISKSLLGEKVLLLPVA